MNKYSEKQSIDFPLDSPFSGRKMHLFVKDVNGVDMGKIFEDYGFTAAFFDGEEELNDFLSKK
jgi:hypothetical protein